MVELKKLDPEFNSMPERAAHTGKSLLRLGITHFLLILGMISLIGLSLFISAGRLDWWEVWVFLGIYLVIAFMVELWLLRHDPQLLKERDQAIRKQDVKNWDRLMTALNLPLMIALFVVIGLDAGRHQWSSVPLPIRIIGGLGVLFSFGLTVWASSVNTFMSAMVRIQKERGHRTITLGPYRFIRHPMYLGMCISDIGFPLLLNSWVGLLISVMMIAAVVIRTALEDRSLSRELPGYSEYIQQVRYRLLPRIW